MAGIEGSADQIDHVDHHAVERKMLFAAEIHALALLFAGEPDERVAPLADAVREGLEDVLGEVELDLFLGAIIQRKVPYERNAVPTASQ